MSQSNYSHLHELRRALQALRLEVSSDIATDIQRKAAAALREAYMSGHSRQTNWESYSRS